MRYPKALTINQMQLRIEKIISNKNINEEMKKRQIMWLQNWRENEINFEPKEIKERVQRLEPVMYQRVIKPREMELYKQLEEISNDPVLDDDTKQREIDWLVIEFENNNQ